MFWRDHRLQKKCRPRCWGWWLVSVCCPPAWWDSKNYFPFFKAVRLWYQLVNLKWQILRQLKKKIGVLSAWKLSQCCLQRWLAEASGWHGVVVSAVHPLCSIPRGTLLYLKCRWCGCRWTRPCDAVKTCLADQNFVLLKQTVQDLDCPFLNCNLNMKNTNKDAFFSGDRIECSVFFNRPY